MVRRDSLGIKQVYGAEERHGGKHVQWLTAGAGMQHEEMWDVGRGEWWWSDQELFQIWVNLPREYKMVTLMVELLQRHVVGKGDEGVVSEECTPVVEREDGVVTTVVCGEYDGMRSLVDCPTNVSICSLRDIPRRRPCGNMPCRRSMRLPFCMFDREPSWWDPIKYRPIIRGFCLRRGKSSLLNAKEKPMCYCCRVSCCESRKLFRGGLFQSLAGQYF